MYRYLCFEITAQTVFWDVTLCTLINRHQCFGGLVSIFRQQVPPKHWYLSTKLYGVTFLFSAVKPKVSISSSNIYIPPHHPIKKGGGGGGRKEKKKRANWCRVFLRGRAEKK